MPDYIWVTIEEGFIDDEIVFPTIQGVFTSRDDAIAACRDTAYVVMRLPINTDLHEIDTDTILTERPMTAVLGRYDSH